MVITLKNNRYNKIVLFFPPGWESLMPPLGISSIKSYLQLYGYDVFCIDFGRELNGRFFNGNRNDLDKCVKKIISLNPDVVGFTALQPKLRHLKSTLYIVKELKKLSNQIKIIAGGPHAAYAGDALIELDFIDMVIKGEGELSLLQYLTSSGFNKRKIIDSEWIDDLNKLPFPNFDDFDLSKYPLKTLPIITSRGCKMNCSFCGIRSNGIHGSFREKSPKRVISELKEDINRYGIVRFVFNDTLINANPRTMIKINENIIENNFRIKWLAEAYPHISKSDLRIMHKAGCRFLYLCPESGSPDTIKKMNKLIDLNLVEKTIRNADRVGIKVSVWFIIGFPNETYKDIEKTESFVKKIRKYCYEIVFVPFSLCKGSDIYNHPKKYGIESCEESKLDINIRKYTGSNILIPSEAIRFALKLWNKYDITNYSYPFLNHNERELSELIKSISPDNREEVLNYIKESNNRKKYSYLNIYDKVFQ